MFVSADCSGRCECVKRGIVKCDDLCLQPVVKCMPGSKMVKYKKPVHNSNCSCDSVTCVKANGMCNFKQTCKLKDNKVVQNVGCYSEWIAPMNESKLLFNDRSSIVWDKKPGVGFHNYSCNLVCRCAKAAQASGYRYISIRFWGLCMASNEMGRATEKSERCAKIDGSYQRCGGDSECVGEAHGDYVYMISTFK